MFLVGFCWLCFYFLGLQYLWRSHKVKPIVLQILNLLVCETDFFFIWAFFVSVVAFVLIFPIFVFVVVVVPPIVIGSIPIIIVVIVFGVIIVVVFIVMLRFVMWFFLRLFLRLNCLLTLCFLPFFLFAIFFRICRLSVLFGYLFLSCFLFSSLFFFYSLFFGCSNFSFICKSFGIFISPDILNFWFFWGFSRRDNQLVLSFGLLLFPFILLSIMLFALCLLIFIARLTVWVFLGFNITFLFSLWNLFSNWGHIVRSYWEYILRNQSILLCSFCCISIRIFNC